MIGQRYERARVVKRLAPHQPGAIKLAARFGNALVCVRYRHDDAERQRYTTVELVVDEAPIQSRQRRAGTLQLVALDIPPTDTLTQRLLRQHGALWDSKARLWYMQFTAAKELGLLDRVV